MEPSNKPLLRNARGVPAVPTYGVSDGGLQLTASREILAFLSASRAARSRRLNGNPLGRTRANTISPRLAVCPHFLPLSAML
jgi:hypothetical protein